MTDLVELLDHYFSLGVAEGKEGRNHDTPDGEAQATRDLIDLSLDRVRRELAELKERRVGNLEAAGTLHDELMAVRRELAEARAENDRLRERLQFDPGGGDAIDALESAMEHLRHHAAEARAGAFREAAAIAERDGFVWITKVLRAKAEDTGR